MNLVCATNGCSGFDAVMAGLSTGGREGQILNLEWWLKSGYGTGAKWSESISYKKLVVKRVSF